MIYFPESYRMFHARSSQSAQGRAIGDLVNLSRHRRQSLIFDVQNAAHIDRNILSEADVVLIKEPGPFVQGFERPQLKPLMDAARAAFAGVSPSRRKQMVWVFAPSSGIQGRLMENRLPEFWTDALSRIFSDTTPRIPNSKSTQPGTRDSKAPRAPARRGAKTSQAERSLKAAQLRDAGYSYAEIGKMMGISKSQGWKLVHQRR